MKLTPKLLGFLNRVFNKDPGAMLALRLNYDGAAMSWKVADGILTTSVTGGSGAPLRVDLSLYTLAGLAAYLAAQPGYSLPYVTSDAVQLGLSARTLIDASGNPAESNGDHIQAYTSVLWAWMEPVAGELTAAKQTISQAPLQMSVPTAEAEWLDNLGDYYAVPRLTGESDAQYAARMIASIGKPLGNNVAMESAINVVTGGLQARVVDAPAQAFTNPYAGTSYGLFDVVYSIALDGDDTFDTYTTRVRAVVEAYRDAGTHMRSITASGDLADAYPTETIQDSASTLSIGVDPVEAFEFKTRRHDGTYRRDGSQINNWDGLITFNGEKFYGISPGTPITFNNSSEEVTLVLTIAGVQQPPESF